LPGVRRRIARRPDRPIGGYSLKYLWKGCKTGCDRLRSWGDDRAAVSPRQVRLGQV